MSVHIKAFVTYVLQQVFFLDQIKILTVVLIIAYGDGGVCSAVSQLRRRRRKWSIDGGSGISGWPAVAA